MRSNQRNDGWCNNTFIPHTSQHSRISLNFISHLSCKICERIISNSDGRGNLEFRTERNIFCAHSPNASSQKVRLSGDSPTQICIWFIKIIHISLPFLIPFQFFLHFQHLLSSFYHLVTLNFYFSPKMSYYWRF